MTVAAEEELEGLRRAGRAVAAVLAGVREAVEPGVTTAELDALAAELLAAHGARSAPQLVYDFPGAICLSVDDEVVHGVPDARPLRPGSLLTIDVTAELDGYMADAAVSVSVPPAQAEAERLARCARRALRAGMAQARAGRPIAAIGGAVHDVVRRHRYAILPELSGHGIGRTIHEEPTVPNVATRSRERLHEGLVITIEPLLAARPSPLVLRDDGWTVATANGAWASHAEHTIVITRGEPIVLTAAA